MKAKSKKNIKIYGATSMVLFSLVAVFTATIAWFSLNKHVNSSGLTIHATHPSGRLNKIMVHEFEGLIIDEENDETFYSFNREATTIFGTGATTTIPTFDMGEYDLLSIEHPLLIIFELRSEYTTSSTEGDLYTRGSTQTPGFLGATNASGAPVYGLGPGTTLCTTIDDVDYYPLSSVVNFKCTYYSEDGYTALLNASSLDTRIDINTESIHLDQSFVNFTAGSTEIIFKQQPEIFSSPAEVDIQYIAMVVNYDSSAISAIYSTFLGNEILESSSHYDGKLNFTCDWSLEVF